MRFKKIYISQSINIQASKNKTISPRNLSQNNSSTLFEPINGSSVKETMTVNGYNSTGSLDKPAASFLLLYTHLYNSNIVDIVN